MNNFQHPTLNYQLPTPGIGTKLGLVFAALLVLVAGCSAGHRSWVIGEHTPLTGQEEHELALASEAAWSYIDAWVDEDYRTMFSLESRHTTREYKDYLALSKTWRTKGFAHYAGTDPSQLKKTPNRLDLTTGISGMQTRAILALLAVDKATLQQIADAKWPERVMLLRMTIARKPCGLLMGKEHGKWLVLNQPGALEAAEPGFWSALKGKRDHPR